MATNLPTHSYNPKPQIVEFEVQSQNKTNTNKVRQIVTQAAIPEKLKLQESEDKLRFLSEKLQRVREQTRAQNSGLTRNVNLPGPSGKQGNLNPKSKASLSKSEKDGLAQRAIRAREDYANGGGLGLPTIAENVDVKIGSMTALNTDKYLFYSFYNRVNELVYMRWAPLVQMAQERVNLAVVGHSSTSKWATIIEIWVKPSGEFHSAHIMKESGIRDFDAAAVSAFKSARFFPNPPKELVEEDGFIHLNYNLTVFFEPSALANGR
jgi:TonB family protein